MTAWPTVPFFTAVEDQTGGNVKTLQSEYRTFGRFPIVDQGKDLVGGYTNDAARLCRSETPVIVFGDHTRALKYADFPFGLGADGVKVLAVRHGFDPKFVFHYLRSLDIPSAGYSRHFKFLKDRQVPRPPMEEQRRIAAILDQADALRAKRHEALAHLDDLIQSIFLDMFGHPDNNPKGFPVSRLRDLCQLGTGTTPSRNVQGHYGGAIPWVKTGEVAGGRIMDTEEHLTDFGRAAGRCRVYPVESIVMALYGQGKTRGQCAVLGIEAATNQACAVLQPDQRYDTTFLFAQLRLSYERLRSMARGGNQANLNLGLVGGFEVVVPDKVLQEEFSRHVGRSSELQTHESEQLAELDLLFASLQSRAFAGDL